jgi:hypothetical protein
MNTEELIAAAHARLDAGIADEKSKNRAKSIQPGGPGTVVTCPSCKHACEFKGDALAGRLQCDECKAVMMHGVLRPRVTHTPHPKDPRFIIQTIESQTPDGSPVTITLTFDREFGGQIARDLLSVCP